VGERGDDRSEGILVALRIRGAACLTARSFVTRPAQRHHSHGTKEDAEERILEERRLAGERHPS
jgi:hypothetical protein